MVREKRGGERRGCLGGRGRCKGGGKGVGGRWCKGGGEEGMFRVKGRGWCKGEG